ncbi:MAG: Crp/Fnr family transcriptional regulator [Symploca sp. SIO2D2]|nr:Crp/Fnr family transcriptional regulator [Symploca sp. SIO2D2]
MDLKNLTEGIGELISKKRSEIVFRQGEKDTGVYIVQAGLLKAYYLSADGKEHVKSFISEGSFISSLTAAYSKNSCSFTLSCLEDSDLIRLPFDRLQEAALKDLELSKWVITHLLQLSMKKEKREYDFLSLSAEQRYEQFCREFQHIINRLTQYDIARYIGITPVALSRIRSRRTQ